jgi:hypothetical protein
MHRVNVRRLLVFIKRAIKQEMQKYAEWPNNEDTRCQIHNNIVSLMQRVMCKRNALNNYRWNVICDLSNNPAYNPVPGGLCLRLNVITPMQEHVHMDFYIHGVQHADSTNTLSPRASFLSQKMTALGKPRSTRRKVAKSG